MAKSKAELLQYAVKMLQRGDTYYHIKQYLERNTSDEATVNEVITVISELEKVAKPVQQKRRNISLLNLILGSCFIVAGIILFFFLMRKGFIATLPIILIVVGISALSFDRFTY